jgi:DNA-directed RNA polymerase specialized sigma24 family protein
MPLTLDRIMELVREYDAIGGQIAQLDEQRAGLEAKRAAVRDEIEGRKPGRRPRVDGAASVKASAPASSSTSSAPASKLAKAPRVEQELAGLLPWLGTIQSESRRKIIQLRAGGKLPEAIAKELRLEHKAVSNAIYQGRVQLRAARQSGAKAKPSKTPASDAEDEPGAPEVLDELDAYNASTVAPVPAPAADASVVHLWSPDSGGTPACGLPYAPHVRMSTKPEPVTCTACIAAKDTDAAAKTPRPPEWTLGWLRPEVRSAYEKVALDGISIQTVAWFENAKATVISGRVNGARSQIARLMRWEAEREAEGNPLTHRDRQPPEKYSEAAAAADPLLAILTRPETPETLSAPEPPAEADAPEPPAKPQRRDLVAQLEELRPFIDTLAPLARQVVELRIGGLKPSEIAHRVQVGGAKVSELIWKARLDMENRSRRRPPPAPLPTEWEPPVDPTGRKPGEIDPEVDLSEFFADEPAPAPSPDVEGEGQEGRNAEKLAELQALREYFHGLSPNQRYIVEATIDGVEQETMAARQGASRQSIRTSLAMAISRLRELKAVAAAGRAFVPIERVRGKTIGLHPLGRTAWNRLNGTVGKHHVDQDVDYPDDVERPRTRGDCADMPRPCPFVSCRHHLYLDVHPDSGALKLNFGTMEVDELRESCALDVADRGGVTLEETGAILNLTRERIRQIEVSALESAATNVRRRKIAVDLPDNDDHESPLASLQRAS